MWVADLEQLHSNVPPEPYAQARAVIVADLGDTPEALFASFEQDAFAAASTAQVHRATLADGTCVAVKVQRPDIDAMVRADRIQSTAANTGAGLVISSLTIGTAILTTAISQLVPVFLVLLVAGVMFAWRIPRPSSKR